MNGAVDAAGPSPSVPAASEKRRFQILALDGGGARALFTAHVLARLEEDLDVRVADSFDLIAGTSAGGIIALGLGAGLRPSEIAEHYRELVKKVFPRSQQQWWRWSARAFRPRYGSEALREALANVLGDRVLGDSEKRLIVPSWDVREGGVHIFKTPHHRRLNRDGRIPMVDVAMATSAAPTYFAAANVDGHRLIDGGIWANNPSVVAISEAVSMLGVPLDAIRVLNVGTLDTLSRHPKWLDKAGFAGWAIPAPALMSTASSRGAQGVAQHLVGKSDFCRFDATVPARQFNLDRADPKDLAGYASSVSRTVSPTYADCFADHVAPVYTPMRGPRAEKRSANSGVADAIGEDPDAAR